MSPFSKFLPGSKSSRIGTRGLFLALISFVSMIPGARAQVTPLYSDLWGVNGEKWTPQSRLPDFSFAGYKMGGIALPVLPVVANVKDFGAKGDGSSDDSQAFLNAINAASNGAVYIPEGRYVIRKRLSISKSQFVLRGAGRGKTILYFPDHLTTAVGPDISSTTGGKITSNYSWSHGFIEFVGEDTSREALLASVTSETARGGKTFTVSSAAKLFVGMQVLLTETDNGDNTLAYHLNAGQYAAGGDQKGTELVNLVSRIQSISGNQVTLERPLRADLLLKWNPRLFAVEHSVRNVGVEGLTMEFPQKVYPGHHRENGYNAMQFEKVMDCWVKNVGLMNADSGIFSMGSRSCTVDDIEYDAYSGRYSGTGNEAGTGHHGFYADRQTADFLMQNFNFKVRFVHELTVGKGSNGNVFRNGRGVDMAFDNHGLSPYENLYSNVDAGAGSRSIYFSGGGAAVDWGPHTSARLTFWNVRSTGKQRFPNRLWPDWCPDQINVIGVNAADASEKNATRRWYEAIAPEQLQPQDLYAAQLAKRATGSTQPPPGGMTPMAGYKQLVMAHSAQCMDVSGASKADDASVIQWTCGVKDNQMWEFLDAGGGQYQIRVKHSQKCLDAKNPAAILVATCEITPKQLWTLNDLGGGKFSLKSVLSQKCIDVNAASTKAGTALIQYTCHGKPNQQFSQK